MNKLIIALSLACASAYVFADTIVGATPKTTKADWFNATAGSDPSGGEFTGATVTVEGGKYVIDSELVAVTLGEVFYLYHFKIYLLWTFSHNK